jgi:hypothetical protein
MSDIVYSGTPNTPISTIGGVSLDNVRRIYNLGDRVAQLAIKESPFFVYLSKVGKAPTDDPVFKFLEQRHQWQRRNFGVQAQKDSTGLSADIADFRLGAKYDKYGRVSTTYVRPEFLLPNQTIQFRARVGAAAAGTLTDSDLAIVTAKVVSLGTAAATYQPVTIKIVAVNGNTDFNAAHNMRVLADADGQVIGSAFMEATGAPQGWKDELYTREGYCQIFKTAVPLFSGTSLSTRYRGIANEWQRVWMEKLREHKMDIEYALLAGVGRHSDAAERYSWGIVPFTERYGVVQPFSYTSSGYDSFVDFLKDFMAPESGNSNDKLVLASRKVLAWFQKLQVNGFLKNTVTAESYQMDVQNIKGQFGHKVTKVETIFGNLHFIEEPLFRGLYENTAIAIDLKNVKYRPLAANGKNRDTHIITNVQNNDMDGRKDMILTEAGLEINLPETHAVMKWS